MTLPLKDIIDLDYLLGLDERAMENRVEGKWEGAGKEHPEDIPARDRDIFKQVNGKSLDERQLLTSWLEFRRLVFFDRSGPAMLPGETFSLTFQWAARFMAVLGFLTGLVTVYSFLAYHGTRPINVTLFFAGFILLPFLIFLGALALTLPGRKPSVVQSIFPFLVFRGIPGLMKKMGRMVSLGRGRDSLEHVFSLFSRKRLEYGSLFFWPLFILPSLFALGFSLGSLGGTLFRVVISDMAFGWQSTLSAGPDIVFNLVHKIALPWSWFLPSAVPNLEQIEGSRIILKQGIESLATESLVSWWPFLCMGILTYSLLPRIVLILIARTAGLRRVNQFDFNRPRFRKLLIRMQTPVMDLSPDTCSPGPGEGKEPEPPSNPVLSRKLQAGKFRISPAPALILASSSIYGKEAVKAIIPKINRQLALDIREWVDISFDCEKDRTILEEMDGILPDQIVLLHEAWQPPIRGILHYLVQMKSRILEAGTLWIILTRMAEEGDLSLDPADPDVRVWKRAVEGLGSPDIVVERLSERMTDDG